MCPLGDAQAAPSSSSQRTVTRACREMTLRSATVRACSRCRTASSLWRRWSSARRCALVKLRQRSHACTLRRRCMSCVQPPLSANVAGR
jgi:hypothetical protein